MAEKVLALVDYLVGEDCILSTLTTHIRGQGRSKDLPHGYLPLHGDDPHPHAGFHNAVTVNICLTDVTEESGCLAFVPGSHKRTRQPTPQERVLAGNDANPEAVPLVAPAGSAVIWPSHTWHGSWESPTPGLRVTLAELYSRPHLQPYELYPESVPDEVLERNSPRFAHADGHGHDVWLERQPGRLAQAVARPRPFPVRAARGVGGAAAGARHIGGYERNCRGGRIGCRKRYSRLGHMEDAQ